MSPILTPWNSCDVIDINVIDPWVLKESLLNPMLGGVGQWMLQA
jgi:hypothetical protein